MSNEVELKLAVTSDAFDTLKTHLNQFKILEQNKVFLGNTYFDYPDHFLAKQKMGLRVRRENNDFTLTLKTDGKVVGGLHSRPEYNLSIPDDSVPTTEQLTSLYPFENLPSAALQPIFSTDFNRTFLLHFFFFFHFRLAKYRIFHHREQFFLHMRKFWFFGFLKCQWATKLHSLNAQSSC